MNKIYISNRAITPLIHFLTEHGFEIHRVDGAGSSVDERIRTHADLYMCQMGLGENARIFIGGRSIPGEVYPDDAVYNAVCTGRYFIHNTRITDVDLLGKAMGSGLETVFVRQGYSRCSCLPVTDTSFITSDMGMAKALAEAGAEVLTIEPEHVALPGFPFGFFAGCAGNILVNGNPALIFNGDLATHPDHEKIAAFAKDRDVDIIDFKGYPLEDIGSILFAYQPQE